jgi:hypothetical protein
MTIQIVRPDHRAASAVRSIYNSVFGNINPLAVDAYAIVIILGVLIGVINALRVRAFAAGPFAAVQARVPTVQLGGADDRGSERDQLHKPAER